MSDKIVAVVPDALVILKRTETGNKNGEDWKRDTIQIRTKAKSGEESNFFVNVSDRIKGLYESIHEEMRGVAEIMVSVSTRGYMRADLLSFEPLTVNGQKGIKI